MRQLAVLDSLLILAAATATAQFTDWSPPHPLWEINTPAVDSCMTISKNGLSLFFSSNRQHPDSLIDRDLYVSQRPTVNDPWGPPRPLTTLNTDAWESCPALSLDEHRLYFTSSRLPSCGSRDIWVSRRQDRRNDFGWEAPANLGCETAGYVNSAVDDLTPSFYEDEKRRLWMNYNTIRPGPSGWDVYQTELRSDDTFGPGTPITIPGVNSLYGEQSIAVRRDGLEIIFLSNRAGEHTSLDFYSCTRASTNEPWSEPVLITSLGFPAHAQGLISLSFDGRELYFTSLRNGNADLYVARREKLRGR